MTADRGWDPPADCSSEGDARRTRPAPDHRPRNTDRTNSRRAR
jgi:hypothetical protein